MQNFTFIKKVGLAAMLLFSACAIHSDVYAQTNDTIGTAAVLTNAYGPFKVSNAAASTINAKMINLYSQGELAVVGIVPGSVIHSLSWYKAVQPTLQNGYSINLTLALRDQVSTVSYGASAAATIYVNSYVSTGFTTVATPTFSAANLPADSGWVTVTFTTPFTYTGGSLEVYCNSVIVAGSGAPASAAINWRNTNSSSSNISPTLYSTNTATYNSTSPIFNGTYRPNVIFNYTPGPDCSGTPNAGTISMDTTKACPGMLSGHLNLTGASGEGGITVQWQKKTSADPAFVDVANTSALTLFNQSITVPTQYRVNVTCAASGITVTSPIFTMQPMPSYIPSYSTDFNFGTTWSPATIPNCWEGRKGLMDYPVAFLVSGGNFTAGSWSNDGWNNASTLGAARIRLTSTAYDWFLTPIIDLGTGNWQIDVDLGVFTFNAQGAGVMDSDDEFDIVISTDGGATFSQADIIKTVNAGNTTFPLTNGAIHVTVPLTGYTGNVRIAFFGTGGSMNPTPTSLSPDVMIDNFQINPFGTVLPVKMSLLEAVANKNGSSSLSWKTYSEESNTGFTIQKSTDGKNFSKISFVPSKAMNGNSNATLNYYFNDAEIKNGEVYYRIIQTDKNNNETYSNIVRLSFDQDATDAVRVYPNPAQNAINIRVESAVSNGDYLTITDLTGKVLITQRILTTQMKVDITALPAGLYFLNVMGENNTSRCKITKVSQ